MAHSKLYRNFIILQGDERGGNSQDGKVLSGYAKVEAKGDKCKISFYAQNLKTDNKYGMFLICSKKDCKELINLGPLKVSDHGKADESNEYYVDNIANMAISYDKITGAAIATNINSRNEYIMYGFMNGEQPAEDWRNYKVVKSYKEQTKSSKQISKSISKPKIKEVVKPETDSKNDEVKVDIKQETDVKQDIDIKEVDTKEVDVKNIDINKDIDIKKDTDIKEEVEIKEDIDINKDIDIKCDTDIKRDTIKQDLESTVKETESTDVAIIKDSIIEEDKTVSEERNKSDKECKTKHNESKNSSSELECKIKKILEDIPTTKHKININIGDIDTDCKVYVLIKKLNECSCSWEKYEKKIDYEKPCYSNKRIDENTRLDMDCNYIDFNKYENEIEDYRDSNLSSDERNIKHYFENIVKDFKISDEKLEGIDNCTWYKVDVSSVDDLCDESNYDKYTLAYYPMINYYPYIVKSNHFLLGYKFGENSEIKYIVYAIPGTKEKDNQPYGGKTGFVTWTSDDTRGQGYWLMFYDFKNSTIVVPLNKK